MAKPAITKRAVKAAALTYAELDTNFQNLADATLTLTAGSGGTQVTADLNGAITLVAGTGITLTGNNTAKTVTITGATTGLFNVVEDTTPQLGGALDVNGQIITSTGNGAVELNPAGTGAVRLIANSVVVGSGLGTVTIDTNSGQTLQLRDPFTDPTAISLGATNVVNVFGNLALTGDRISLSGAGGSQNFITTDGDDSITLRTNGVTGSQAFVFVSGGANGGVQLQAIGTGFVSTNSPFRLAVLSTVDRDALTATNGMMIYNTSTNKFQGRANGTWVDLH
jgi:hypothetical protein